MPEPKKVDDVWKADLKCVCGYTQEVLDHRYGFILIGSESDDEDKMIFVRQSDVDKMQLVSCPNFTKDDLEVGMVVIFGKLAYTLIASFQELLPAGRMILGEAVLRFNKCAAVYLNAESTDPIKRFDKPKAEHWSLYVKDESEEVLKIGPDGEIYAYGKKVKILRLLTNALKHYGEIVKHG